MFNFSFFVFMFLSSFIQSCRSDNYTDGSELILAYLVHRHGDRTTFDNDYVLPEQIPKYEELVKPYGYGHLTDSGLETSYKLGEWIRRRYGEHLSSKYNSSEIYIRSTDFERTKMTVLMAMAAVYPPTSSWNSSTNWIPVPYTTVPMDNDYILALENCPLLLQNINHSLSSNSTAMEKYKVMFDQLAELGYNIIEKQHQIIVLHQSFLSQLNVKLNVNPKIQELMPEISNAADEAMAITFGNTTYISLEAGVMLNDFLNLASAAIAGQTMPKIRIYSAHDVNVYAMEVISRAEPRQGVPKYGSAFALELRRNLTTGTVFVLPIYLGSPKEDVKYLQIDGCSDEVCDIEQFKILTSNYTMTESEWRLTCGVNKSGC